MAQGSEAADSYTAIRTNCTNCSGCERLRLGAAGLDEWYSNDGVCSSFRAIRRAKLARVLRFYADKARRHDLPREQYEIIATEIDRMIEKGEDYAFPEVQRGDRGWVFCPEYAGARPLVISPADWDTRIFLFGPGMLSDSDSPPGSIVVPPGGGEQGPVIPPVPQEDVNRKPDGSMDATDQEQATLGDERREEKVASAEDAESDVELIPSVCLGTDLLTGAELPVAADG